MHQALQGATFYLEHIIPVARGGLTELENLAWACPRCNLRKAVRVEVTDPVGGESVHWFHPRQDQWNDHFVWEGHLIAAKSAVGRATIAALDLNEARRIFMRQAEELLGLFPPTRL
jgi:hypothetical protein